MSSLESGEELDLVLWIIDDVMVKQLNEETTSSANEVAVGMKDNGQVKWVQFVDEVEKDEKVDRGWQ